MSYFRNPIPKSQRPEKVRYIVHSCHGDTVNKKRDWSKCEFLRFVSIDPGRANLAIRIEKRYRAPGSPIITEELDKYNISEHDVNEDGISSIYSITTLIFEKYRKLIEQSHVVLIEKQMPFNYKAVRISQHIISYFTIMLTGSKLLPLIVEIDAKIKTEMLKVSDKMNERDIKKWAVKEGTRLLEIRNDQVGLDKLNATKGKLDDVCDTIVQIEAACHLFGWRTTPEVVILQVGPQTNMDDDENTPPLKFIPSDVVSSVTKEQGGYLIVTTKIRKNLK